MHGTFTRSVPSAMEYRHGGVSFGADDWERRATDGGAIARVKRQLATQEGEMDPS